MVPVVPQIPYLCSWNQAVRYRREDVAALSGNSWIESEGGDYAQHFTHLVVHEALVLGVTDLELCAVAPREPGEVRSRNAQDRAGEFLQASEKRCVVTAEG